MDNVWKPPVVICTAAILVFSSYILFYKLGNEPFQDYDEATYALVTHESLEHGVPPTLTFLNTPFLRKPPLLFWMTTAIARAFKHPEFADRFPSALAGLAAIVIVGLICMEAGAGIWTALLAATILATTAGWMEFARDVRFDNLVALFDVAALYAALRAVRDSRWFVMVGITLALSILSKSVVALFGGIAVLAVLIYEGKSLNVLRDRQFWLGVGAFFIVAAPWHIYMTLTYGAAFWHDYLGTEVLQRASTDLFPGNGNPTNLQYIGYLLGKNAPWTEFSILAFVGAPLLMRRMSGRMRSTFGTALVASLSVLAVDFFAKTKAYGYLMPLFPFAAVVVAIAGAMVWRWIRDEAARQSRAAFIPPLLLGATFVLFANAAALTRYEALHLDPYYSWDLSQAYEERAVGQIIHSASNPQVYAYGGYDFLGTIYYYSALPDTQNPYILLWEASSTPSATSTNFILATSTLQSLSASFPQYRFVQDYAGRYVSLFSVMR